MNDCIKPLDLALFRGTEIISNTISTFEELHLSDGSWTHVGIFITKDVLDVCSSMEKDKLYILESIVSSHDIPNVATGTLSSGIQIRSLDSLMRLYSGKIAYASLKNRPSDLSIIKPLLNEVYNNTKDIPYSYNCLNMIAALFSCCRPLRDVTGEIIEPISTNRMKFCSQYVGDVYQHLGLLHKDVKTENIVPMDFIGYDSDYEIPTDMFLPPILLRDKLYTK